MKSNPLVSVVLNVYNESKNIEECLSRIRKQNYPQERIEIIIVDDKSEDNTVELAKKFDVKVFTSGHRNRERAKSIGLEHVGGQYILFMDADVFLISNDWIKRAVSLLEKYPKASAVQNVRWQYKKNDYTANRYCNLFGVNDPLVYFLGKRGALMATEKKWKKAVMEEGQGYALVEFTSSNLPTMGAQGFMARTEDIKKTSWKPYFFHLDSVYELVEMGKNKFIFADLEVEHKYVRSIIQFHRKLVRNLTLFLELEKYRKYKYEVNPFRFLFALILMVTFVYPLWQSIKGYMKKPDTAWFLHPIFCFTVPFLYLSIVLSNKVRKI